MKVVLRADFIILSKNVSIRILYNNIIYRSVLKDTELESSGLFLIIIQLRFWFIFERKAPQISGTIDEVNKETI
jgi:hypothetical protein